MIRALAVLLIALPLQAARVDGTVVESNAPMAGVSVELRSANATFRTTTNADGTYLFATVPPGEYELLLEHEWLETHAEEITVGSADVNLPIIMDIAGTNCMMTVEIRACSDEPSGVWGHPSCAEYGLNESLIAAMKEGDRSAAALLEKRFDSASTHLERLRIAHRLLGNVKDDSRYFDHLAEHAGNAIRYAGDAEQEAYRRLCAARGYNPESYREFAVGALVYILEEPRARDLLLRAVATKNGELVGYGIYGLALQRVTSALPEIEKAIERGGEEAAGYARSLAMFRSREADAIAMKYILDDYDRRTYREKRFAPKDAGR